jgi:hypothetical protein
MDRGAGIVSAIALSSLGGERKPLTGFLLWAHYIRFNRRD